MKGVILSINPNVTVVDITHEIPAGDIRAGAFALAASHHFFPKGTVHVAVVDPGVGSKRIAIAIRTERYTYIGPDNGVLSWGAAQRKQTIKSIHAITNDAYFLHPVSQTFHGRDIFAPVAAHLTQGVSPRSLGPTLREFVRLPWPEPKRSRGGIEGEIIYIDRFGNAITNVEAESLKQFGAGCIEMFARGKRLCQVAQFYQAVPKNQPVAVPGSRGFLEIAVNGGSAERRLSLRIGDRVLARGGAVDDFLTPCFQ